MSKTSLGVGAVFLSASLGFIGWGLNTIANNAGDSALRKISDIDTGARQIEGGGIGLIVTAASLLAARKVKKSRTEADDQAVACPSPDLVLNL